MAVGVPGSQPGSLAAACRLLGHSIQPSGKQKQKVRPELGAAGWGLQAEPPTSCRAQTQRLPGVQCKPVSQLRCKLWGCCWQTPAAQTSYGGSQGAVMAKTTKDFSLLHCWTVTCQKLLWATHCSATEHPRLLHHRSLQARLSFTSRTSWGVHSFELGHI